MSGPVRLSLAQQLKKLESETKNSSDPDTAYSSLDTLTIPTRENGQGREHYLSVGPSRLRQATNRPEQTLLTDKYAGKRTGRVKIFDDDDDEDEQENEEAVGNKDEDDESRDGSDGYRDIVDGGGEAFGEVEGSEDELDGSGAQEFRGRATDGKEDEGAEDEDEEDDQEDDDDDEDEDEDGEEGSSDEGGQDGEGGAPIRPTQTKSRIPALDPVASLRESRLKDVEKGRGIKRQRDLFDTIVTLRITFQKALAASSKLTTPLPTDAAGEIDGKKRDALRSLGDLNEKLFSIREALILPGAELPASLGKRKRAEADEILDDKYWLDSTNESLALVNTSHPPLLAILNKWSTKIQAASLQLGSKQAGGSKFLQSTKNGAGGIVEAIEAGLASKRSAGKSLMESEEDSYRSLLREVIETRGSGPGVELSHLRKEKKKKREAERGGSKGRKLRYTVHEKAQNFVVPIPLSHAWHDEQIDELFSSLFGGVGMQGAASEGPSLPVTNGSEGMATLGGLRVF